MKRFKQFLNRPVAAVALGFAMVLAGCGGGSSGSSTGTLRVGLTDNPHNFNRVVLTIQEVRAVQTGQGNASTAGLPVIKTFSPPSTVDVLTLHFAQAVLGEALVPAGSYEQVRLVLAANVAGQDPVNFVTLNTDPNTKIALDTPSGQESGLKIVGQFSVTAGVINAILLDFNPDKAIVSAGSSGRFLLKPTGVRIVQTSTTLSAFGSLSGTVLPSTAWSTAVVSVVPQGSGTAIASGSVNPDDGTFRALVPAGTYKIRVTASGFVTFDSSLTNLPQFFTVSTGQETAVGTIALSQ